MGSVSFWSWAILFIAWIISFALFIKWAVKYHNLKKWVKEEFFCILERQTAPFEEYNLDFPLERKNHIEEKDE